MSDYYDARELKQIALWLREQIRMRDTRHLNMVEVLDRMRNCIPGFDYRRVQDSDVEKAEGLYDSALSYLPIPDSMFEALIRNGPRARFTCAHEIGHWVLEHEGRRFRRLQRKAYERSTPNIRRNEREAESFAAFFLAPDHLTSASDSISDLQRKFGLSRRAAEIRKSELEADARRAKGERRPLPNSIVDFLEQARAKGYRVTSLPPKPQETSQTEEKRVGTVGSATVVEDKEICIDCGNFTLRKMGLQMICETCGKRVAL